MTTSHTPRDHRVCARPPAPRETAPAPDGSAPSHGSTPRARPIPAHSAPHHRSGCADPSATAPAARPWPPTRPPVLPKREHRRGSATPREGTGRAGTRTTGPVAAKVLAATSALALAGHVVPAATWLPGVRRALFPGLAGLGEPGHVALTFDDGPHPDSTPYFLDLLDRLTVHATFFVLGEAVQRHPGLTRDIARRGHELAVHGWTHSRPWWPAPGQDLAEVTKAAAVLRDVAGTAPRWYRPPYGILTGGRWLAARRCGLRPVLWTAWGRDWTVAATAASVLETVRGALHGGGTILLHDTDRTTAPDCWRVTLEMLPDLVAHCRAAGLAVGPLVEHGVLPPGPGTAAG